MGRIRRISDLLSDKIPDGMYCSIINIRNKFRGYKLSILPIENRVFLAETADGSLFFSRRNRYFNYKLGIPYRMKLLANNYLFQHISFDEGDTVIDCGANIGEIGLALKQHKVSYHAFEPEEKEAHCCDLNNYDGKKSTNRVGLWNENTVLKFYSKPDSADSSIFPADDNLTAFEIPVITLQHYLHENNIKHVRLAKIEAEGAEPEVLEGAQAILHLIDYVSVDCGFERGKKQASTFYESNKILTENNFEIVDADLRRNVFLFRRHDI